MTTISITLVGFHGGYVFIDLILYLVDCVISVMVKNGENDGVYEPHRYFLFLLKWCGCVLARYITGG